ncbi:MAG: PA2778 family cysteine peptidase [Burkholderiales bacterium]|nr:PA2778 family cysteine peptidase [Burkholderiales bacterium]
MRSLGAPATAGVLLLSILLAGCASPQVRTLLEHPPAELPSRAELAAVPFFPQQDYQCGPAALAMALTHAGVPASPEALVPQVYLPAREGSLQAEMLAATRRHGLLAYPLAPRLQDLLTEVAAGNPVIVLQNLSLAFAPLWHYAVVVGYDRGREEIILRSGTTRRLAMTLSTFERTWARSRHWAMVVLQPDRLAATATEADHVAAAAALERSSPAAAQHAYAGALARWPANLIARLGFGNTAYALGDLAKAEAAYLQATVEHPQSGDAWNNLAQVRFELGRRSEALAAARKAVALGGPRTGLYRKTLDSIGGMN